MGRSRLDPDEGLWFPGVDSIHTMFMRFPIDALFLGPPDGDGTRAVIAARPWLRPWRGLVLPVHGAAGTLELAAGTLARTGTRVGDRVRFEPAQERRQDR